MSSAWVSMNLLSLDEKRVIVESQETALMEELRALGIRADSMSLPRLQRPGRLVSLRDRRRPPARDPAVLLRLIDVAGRLGTARRSAIGRPAPRLAITNVTVIDTAGGPSRPAMTVVVEGERITAVGETANTRPRRARRPSTARASS